MFIAPGIAFLAIAGATAYGLVMLVQQGCTFWARRRTVLAFTTIMFASIAVFVSLDLLEANLYLTGITMGVSLLCVGWSLDRSPHRAIAGALGLAAVGAQVGHTGGQLVYRDGAASHRRSSCSSRATSGPA